MSLFRIPPTVRHPRLARLWGALLWAGVLGLYIGVPLACLVALIALWR